MYSTVICISINIFNSPRSMSDIVFHCEFAIVYVSSLTDCCSAGDFFCVFLMCSSP